jgi:EAL domain-containing protein (putative c-di-GMP-specific phosphodiesterase class I)
MSLPPRSLRPVLAGGRIQTLYQPIVRIADGTPVGLEVLARLEHPSRGTLMPGLFLPEIERARLATQLTTAVVRSAFADWSGKRLDEFGLTLALNFPLDVLVAPSASAWMEAQRGRAGIRADQLVLELTESRPVKNLAELGAAISGLRAMDYGLAIDDVGPDARDHTDVLGLPFTILKLDKELVARSRDDGSAQEFMKRTIAAAHAAALTIVAEGVANTEMWHRMRTLGVDQAQGFLVAHPLAAVEVAPWRRDWCSRSPTDDPKRHGP